MDLPDYDPALDTPPLDDGELEALDDLLRALPSDGAMNVEALDGYLTALLVGPRSADRVRTRDWMPAVWGGGALPFASGKQGKRAALLVLRHLHAIDRLLADDPDAWEPVFSVAETPRGDEVVDAEDWCAGFLQAVALEPERWAAWFDDPAHAAALAPIVVLGADDDARGEAERARLADPAERDALARAVPDGVLRLLPPAAG